MSTQELGATEINLGSEPIVVGPAAYDQAPLGAPARARRGRTTGQVITILWRDIPAQVNGQSGRERHQIVLSAKFQRAIDRAKRKASIYTAHEDIAQWRRVTREVDSNFIAEAVNVAKSLEDQYSKEHLGKLGFMGGWEPENLPAGEVVSSFDPNDDPDYDDGDE